VILELKAKAPALMAQGATLSAPPAAPAEVIEPATPKKRAAPPAPPPGAAATADALSALLNLGYNQGEAAEAVALVSAETPEAGAAALIRAALKRLAPRG
jgi:Holliday junction DNA helicase RuvA